MGKVEEDPETLQYSKNYMPWHGHVTALTVAPQYRRQGIATKLMKAFEQACENEDAWFIDLFIRAGNVTAAKLYKGMG
jgi:N-terminal acetyltransferase B complex catalytic subunit